MNISDRPPFENHEFETREVQIDGEPFYHRRCIRCNRNFRRFETSEWRAVHVGVFKFTILSEKIDRQWGSDECLHSTVGSNPVTRKLPTLRRIA